MNDERLLQMQNNYPQIQFVIDNLITNNLKAK